MMNLEIGAKIRLLRLAKNMTQEQLAQRLNLSPQAVSKWENGATLPDIQLLPELSVLLGVTIDALFSMTDGTRFDRIDNMLEDVRFLPEEDFRQTERFLLEKRAAPETRARATLLLAQLYLKRSDEYRDRAAPLSLEALQLNPDEKSAHNAVFDAHNAPSADWNIANHHQLIAFYEDFVAAHPDEPRNYLWLLDLLIADGRTTEARVYVDRMRAVKDDYHYELYMGHICRAEGDAAEAMDWYRRMTDHEPRRWVVWACMGDVLARLGRYDEAVECYRRSMPLRERPRFIDNEEAIGHICEIRGDYAGAIEMQEQILELLRSDWDTTEGEGVDMHLREIERLKKLRDRA